MGDLASLVKQVVGLEVAHLLWITCVSLSFSPGQRVRLQQHPL